MAENEPKHEQFLKKAQLWLAVLVGVVTFAVGAYNAKNLFFSKKGPGQVSIEVRSQNGGAAVPRASLEITKAQGGVVASGDTGSDGKFEQKQIEPGNYMLRVTKASFEQETLLFTVDPGTTARLTVKLKPSSSSIRSTVEDVGSSWLKKFSPSDTNTTKTP